MENLNSKMDYEKLVAALNKQELVNGNLEISEKLAETAQIEWYDPLVQVFTINAKLYRWYGVF